MALKNFGGKENQMMDLGGGGGGGIRMPLENLLAEKASY